MRSFAKPTSASRCLDPNTCDRNPQSTISRLRHATHFPKFMLEQAAAALDRRDYQTAAKLIAVLVEQQPDDHQVQLYSARLQEATNQLDLALAIYRSVLQQAIDPKIVAQARQGIQRIDRLQLEIETQAVALAKAGMEDNIEPGFLVLEPLSSEQKQAVAPAFAKIMGIDPYSARLQLPTRGWRLYKLGTMGELEFYRDRTISAGIPSFCVSQQATQQFFIFRVNYFQSFYPQAEIACVDDRSEVRTFNFNWSEVTQIVMGLLPIFEEVVELDAYNRTYRKPKILDYIQICDVQLGGRKSIFRLCSQTYDFCKLPQSIERNSSDSSTNSTADRALPLTSRDNWKNLMAQIQECVPQVTIQNNFTPFAETAIGFPELMMRIDPHLELLRRADSSWDRAFQLYSMLSMCRKSSIGLN